MSFPPPPPPGRDSDVFSSRGSIALTVQYYSGLLAESWRSTHPPPSSPVMSPESPAPNAQPLALAHNNHKVTCGSFGLWKLMYRQIHYLCTWVRVWPWKSQFLGPKCQSHNGSTPFHRAQRNLDIQGPALSHLPS